jgi:hypothetical protein
MVTISEGQRALHMSSELAALVVAVPFLVYASTRLPTAAGRNAALALAGATVVVDGWLLARYVRRSTHTSLL